MDTFKRIFSSSAVVMFVLLLLPVNGFSEVSDITSLMQDAMKTLGLEKGAEDLGVLTNAHYVRLGAKTTEKYIYDIERVTGCSAGRGNLLFFNERPEETLLIALAHRKTMQSVVIRYDGTQAKVSVLSLKDSDIQNPEFFWNATPGASGKQTFHIASILSAWFAGTPYDFLQCAELHGHICPGTIFGYFTAKGIAAKYPLRPGEKYIFIASPNECKDDAIQAVLGLTPGKKNLIVKPVDKEQIIKSADKIITGILIKWSDSENKGVGVVLAVNLAAVKAVTEVNQQMPRNLKLLAARKLFGRLPDYLDFFSVEKEFPVRRELKEKLVNAGTNPYVALGMMSAAPKASGTE